MNFVPAAGAPTGTTLHTPTAGLAHGFYADCRPSYHDAWQRLAWFREHLAAF